MILPTSPTNQFNALLADEWEARLQHDPIFATYTGDHRFNDRLPHVTEEEMQSWLSKLRGYYKRLCVIDRQTLSDADMLNYDLYQRAIKDEISELEFHPYRIPISKSSGFHQDFPELPTTLQPLDTLTDYNNYLARLTAFKGLVEEYIELMRSGLRTGYIPPRVTLDGIDNQVSAHIVEKPEQSRLFQPFQQYSKSISVADQLHLTKCAWEAIENSVVPGYQALLIFLKEEYIPNARDDIGASGLPDGKEFYAHRIRTMTTLDLTADQVHQTGLDEVSRIREEMQAVIKKVGFQGTFKEFIEFLRDDPRFYAKEPTQLLKEVAYVLKRMDGELPRLFKKLPRTPYGIRPIPEEIAPANTTAYYFPPPGDSSKGGTYYVNTYDLTSRPLYEIEALSLHEAVPGHHLQLALQQEMGDVPDFRRWAGFTAFIEGWALYSERLGLEVGFYQDPYSDFGRLSYEMWRACRLVVDTGMHALGWSRQQAIDFMVENTSSTLLNIANEVDRYIAWPGQALAYKIGELKIRALRSQAEQELGSQFDLREFHDILLEYGAIPLDLLDQRVSNWITKKKGV
jgi:uncharacterized protein (DUF885 family)